jgi:hypothetical protein
VHAATAKILIFSEVAQLCFADGHRLITGSMKPFHVADLRASGELKATSAYEYEHLEQIPGASNLIADFSGSLYRSPEEFERPLNADGGMIYRWRSNAPTCGTTTLRREGGLISFGLLASGLNRDADQITLETFQKHLLRELHGSPYEAAFDLMRISERPLLVTVGFQEPTARGDQLIAALADRCFAAAYFRYLRLV